MSASQEKRRRQSERQEGGTGPSAASRELMEQRKRNKNIGVGLGLFLVVLLSLVIFVNSGVLYNSFAAVKIDDESYSANDFNYFFYTAYSQLAQMFGGSLSSIIDPSIPLSSQQFSEDQTWEDYFMDSAYATMKNIAMLTKEAKAAGHALSDEDKATVDEMLQHFEDNYKTNGFPNVNAFIRANFGSGASAKSLRSILERIVFAEGYRQVKAESFEYSDEELEAYYAEHRDEYDTLSYRHYRVAADFEGTEAPELAEDETEDEESVAAREALIAERMETARTEAQAIADVENEDAFIENIIAALPEEQRESYDGNVNKVITAGSNLDTNLSAWLLDPERLPGDSTVIDIEGSGVEAVYFVERDENRFNPVTVRHILIKQDTDTESLHYDNEPTRVRERIEEIYAEWQSGDATEESFAALAELYSEDTGSQENGGLYEDMLLNQTVPEFNDFIFAEGRAAGDTGIVHGKSSSYEGDHLIYFVSASEDPYRDMIARGRLQGDAYTEWETERLETVSEPVVGYAMRLTRQ